MNFRRSDRGRFVSDKREQRLPALPPPDGVAKPLELYTPVGVEVAASTEPIGLSRIGEWLLVDIRVAKMVDPESRLFKICQSLAKQKACGVIEGTSTLIIDLEFASVDDARFISTSANWPRP